MTLPLAGKDYMWQLAFSHFPAVFLAAETIPKPGKALRNGNETNGDEEVQR